MVRGTDHVMWQVLRQARGLAQGLRWHAPCGHCGAMTAPRQVLPGTTYLVTRRCSQRQFLLRPSKFTNQTFGYLLAVAAPRFRIEVHAFCVMSNHVHLVVTDPDARLPAFSQFLDSLVARAMNALLGRWEHFWGPSSYSAVALQGLSDVVDKVAYVLANPVAAGLVRHGRMWPGSWSAPEWVGADPLEYVRPAQFFRKQGTTALPEKAWLGLVAPRGFDSPAEFRNLVSAALELKEMTAAATLAARGRGFLGAKRVLRQLPFGSPARVEPHRGIKPRIASRDTWRRIQALGCLVEFLRAYRRAFEARRRGSASAVFPAGTYLMRVLHGVSCESPG
jgi:putative transposase